MSDAPPLLRLSRRARADRALILGSLRRRVPVEDHRVLDQPAQQLEPLESALFDALATWAPAPGGGPSREDPAATMGQRLVASFEHFPTALDSVLRVLWGCRDALGDRAESMAELRALMAFFDGITAPLIRHRLHHPDRLMRAAAQRQATLQDDLWVVRLLSELTNDPLVALRADGTVRHVNRAGERLASLQADQPAPGWLLRAACPGAPRRTVVQSPAGERWVVVQRPVDRPGRGEHLTLLRLEPAAASADVGLLRSLLAHGHRLVGLVDRDDLLVDASAALRELLARTPGGRPWALGELCHPNQDAALLIDGLATARDLGAWSGTCLLRDGQGQPVSTAVTVSTLDGALPDAGALLATFEDLRPLDAARAHTLNLATHDRLTGLMNRTALEALLKGTLARHRRTGVPFALAFLDLDGFKGVNDLHGHEAGDAVLQVWARRLQRLVRAGDLVCRYGGDEFVVVLEGLADPTEVEPLARRLLAGAREPFEHAGQAHHLGTSIGLAVYPQDGQTEAALLQAADTAMYAAKGEGRGRVAWFSDAMGVAARRRAGLQQALGVALAQGHIRAALQPVVALGRRGLVGFELLARWDDDAGPVSPAEFVPIAERGGRASALGWLMLKQAVAAAQRLRRPGHPPPWLAVNIAPAQITEPGFARELLALLAGADVAPERVVVEVTESAVATWDAAGLSTATGALAQLRARGVRVALDDYGAGLSSLGRLRALPLDLLKMDGALVEGVEAGGLNLAVLAAGLDLGLRLGLEVVVEGVETEAQAQAVLSLAPEGRVLAQGYLFGRPAPLEDWLEGDGSWSGATGRPKR